MQDKVPKATSRTGEEQIELSKRGRTSIASAVLKTNIHKNQIDSTNKQERNKTNE